MDRNKVETNVLCRLQVVPYVGTWIEIRYSAKKQYDSTSRSLRGNVDRNMDIAGLMNQFQRRSLRGNVDRNLC